MRIENMPLTRSSHFCSIRKIKVFPFSHIKTLSFMGYATGGIRKKERLVYKHAFVVQSDVINSPTKFSRKTQEDVIKSNRSLRTPH